MVDGSNELNDDQIDSLLAGDTSSRDIPMEAPQEEVAPAPQEYSLKVKGQEIKAPLDKVIQWAQMGYDYNQSNAALKKQQEEWQKQVQEKDKYWSEIEQKWTPYKQVDEFATKNPDWWKTVEEQYKQKTAVDENNPVLKVLDEKLKKYDEFITNLSAKEQSQKIEQEDKKLGSEIESIRKQYPNIDFDTPDAEGNSLEAKVLKHAIDNEIKSFKVAYRDYYHDHLLGKAKEEGKELVSKELQKRTKLGILGESPKPSKGLKVAAGVKNKSYNDLMQEALDEINGG